jgi:hypothetical protein
MMDVRRRDIVAGVLAAIIFLAGCRQPQPAVPTSPASECSPTEVEIIWPQLQAVQPDKAVPGAEIKISASGGYTLECGSSYNESHRLFALNINQEQAGMLSCMANHCEALLIVPENLQPGTHIISTEGDSQIEIEIIERGNLEFIDGGEEIPASPKGYELYSWFDDDGWHFTLITGTNRIKSTEEIISSGDVIDEGGWVKITTDDLQALMMVLEGLPGGEQIFWLDGKLMEASGENNAFSFPAEEIIQQVRQHSDKLGLKLHIVQ